MEAEIRAMETRYNLPPKNLVEHGYGRLDAIIKEGVNRKILQKYKDGPMHVLLAPSWGPNGVIESGAGEKIVDQLLGLGYQVTLRPHPMTIKFSKDKIIPIQKKHINNNRFFYEADVAGQESLHDSDVMISDWSGAALDYAFGLNKPVLFIDTPRKVNNKNYKDLNIEPLEVEIRKSIGCIVQLDDIDNCGEYLKRLASFNEKIDKIKYKYVFNIGKSAQVGSVSLRKICNAG